MFLFAMFWRDVMPKRTTTAERIYQLKITLKGSKPPIWRRIEVADTVTLARLHQILQVTMGWSDYHLHQFVIEGISYGVPDPDDEQEVRDGRKVKLNQLLSASKQTLVYEYDFGDGWEHQVVLEKAITPEPDVIYPRCTAGKRACPPEDCGGIWGYVSFLEAIADANHPEHDESLEWVGGSFDPEQFDSEEVNQELRRAR
jgi:hypothetical protein